MGTLGRAGVGRGVPEGSGPDGGQEGSPRKVWAGPGFRGRPGLGRAGVPRGVRALGPGRVADGGGAPPPHIKARGAAGAHKAGREGAERGRKAGTEEGRAGGRREEGGREPAGGEGYAGAARPLLT